MIDDSKLPTFDQPVKTAIEANQLLAAEQIIKLEEFLDNLKAARPDERGELSRRYAIAITETEKLLAYCKVYIGGYTPS